MIRQAYDDNDAFFFNSDAFHFWASIAYDGKTDYKDEEIMELCKIKSIHKVK